MNDGLHLVAVQQEWKKVSELARRGHANILLHKPSETAAKCFV